MTFARSAVVATRSRNARSSLGLWIGARATDVPVATAMASPTSNGVTPFVTLPRPQRSLSLRHGGGSGSDVVGCTQLSIHVPGPASAVRFYFLINFQAGVRS